MLIWRILQKLQRNFNKIFVSKVMRFMYYHKYYLLGREKHLNMYEVPSKYKKKSVVLSSSRRRHKYFIEMTFNFSIFFKRFHEIFQEFQTI